MTRNRKKPGLSAVALFLLLLGACGGLEDPLAPNRNNPAPVSLPAAAFGLRVRDGERGGDPDSLYVFEGVWRDSVFCFGTAGKDTMSLNLTPDNELLLQVVSDAKGFAGINASSSARCIDIVEEGPERRSYRLRRVAEGESVITLWNGEDGHRQEISFRVGSREEIPLQGIRCRVDGQAFDLVLAESASFLEPGDHYHTRSGVLRDVRHFPGWEGLQVLEIVGPVPLNATLRREESLWLLDPADSYFPLLDDGGNCFTGDWPSFVGRAGIAEINRRHYPEYRWFAADRYAERLSGGAPRLSPADLRERRMLVWKVHSDGDYGPRGDYGVLELGFVLAPRQETTGEYDWRLAKERGAKYFRLRLQ